MWPACGMSVSMWSLGMESCEQPDAWVRSAVRFWVTRRSRGGSGPGGFRAIALTEGEFVAVEVVDEDPHVHRLDASMLFLSGEAGVGTRGCGGIHSTQTPRIRTPDMYQRTHTFGREPCWPGIHIRRIS